MVPESVLTALSALSTLGTSSFDIGSDILQSVKYIRGETINNDYIKENLVKFCNDTNYQKLAMKLVDESQNSISGLNGLHLNDYIFDVEPPTYADDLNLYQNDYVDCEQSNYLGYDEYYPDLYLIDTSHCNGYQDYPSSANASVRTPLSDGTTEPTPKMKNSTRYPNITSTSSNATQCENITHAGALFTEAMQQCQNATELHKIHEKALAEDTNSTKMKNITSEAFQRLTKIVRI